MSISTFKLNKYGKNYLLGIEIGRYSNGLFAIETYDYSKGYKQKFSNLTVNLNIETDIFTAFIDEEMVNTLVKEGFGNLTGRICYSGYKQFPEFKFNEDKLKEFDEDGYEEYKAYYEALQIVKEL